MDVGEIIAFDATDGLGLILLDDGRQVRFGLTACGYLRPEPGLRVRVLGLSEGFGGRLKAYLIEAEPTDD